MNGNTKILIGVLAGMAAGAALGLLLAPLKGKDTRDELSLSIKDAGYELQDLTQGQLEQLDNIKEHVKQSISNRFRDNSDFEDHVEHV
ncbi:hypothetical protein PBAL39_02357 [Pedobacter sp. BAL39]|uniref:YtxH domain-containing protein n=1 Tax=Pedobacter sp. BAL39 TaxID=391596 RepID=UPI0001559FC7|nr:YtxH domain-containing protein [Pedobacter sp. BAL39]EDM38420.1 hypothetical protein PBAL39_02357 [Pedobacter sp. BAL39]